MLGSSPKKFGVRNVHLGSQQKLFEQVACALRGEGSCHGTVEMVQMVSVSSNWS